MQRSSSKGRPLRPSTIHLTKATRPASVSPRISKQTCGSNMMSLMFVQTVAERLASLESFQEGYLMPVTRRTSTRRPTETPFTVCCPIYRRLPLHGCLTFVVVFHYEFSTTNAPNKKHVVMWDYQIGLVRITPFFKALGLTKVTIVLIRPISGTVLTNYVDNAKQGSQIKQRPFRTVTLHHGRRHSRPRLLAALLVCTCSLSDILFPHSMGTYSCLRSELHQRLSPSRTPRLRPLQG